MMRPDDGSLQSVKNGPIVVDGSPIKIVVAGSKGSGKSALVVRYLTKRFIVEYKSGIDFIYRNILVQGLGSFELEVMDLSGKDSSTAAAEIPLGIGYIIVYSITDRCSFGFAQRILVKLRESDAEKFIFLIGNKLDLQHLRQVRYDEGRELAVRYGCSFQELSAADCEYSELRSQFDNFFSQCIKSCSNVKVLDTRHRKRPVLNVSKMLPAFLRTDTPSVEKRSKSVASSLPDLASTIKDVFKKKSV
ncbi:ras-related and estrogen-regulated growth inhibitor-like protein [Artemia franciscana]|uniref:ras-related and estrogen-regulated growth inhibitor-like protein n=1 Tax=Artemia franciscana TaxID=6661 RepID=UPI0032DA091C